MKIIQKVKIIGEIITNEFMRTVEFRGLMTKKKQIRDGCVELEQFAINGRKYRFDTDYRNTLWGGGHTETLAEIEDVLRNAGFYASHVKEIMKQFRELEREVNNGIRK